MSRLFQKFEEVFAWKEHGTMHLSGVSMVDWRGDLLIPSNGLQLRLPSYVFGGMRAKDLPRQSLDLQKAPSSTGTPGHACVVSNSETKKCRTHRLDPPPIRYASRCSQGSNRNSTLAKRYLHTSLDRASDRWCTRTHMKRTVTGI